MTGLEILNALPVWGLAAIVIGATFLLAVNLNYPFSGPEPVDPEAIDAVIKRMAAEEARGE